MQNISKDNSYFWEHPSYYALSSDNKEENLDSAFNLNILPIINLKDPSIHYRCPKCGNFPFIEFKTNQEDISYSCACYKDKYLPIKDLFVPENKYLTFLDKENENQILGFKCTNHKSGKSKKFKYFCIICNNNLCKDCLQYHLNKNHDLINLEFQMYEMNKKIVKINNKLNEEKARSEESENITFEEEKSIDNKIDNNTNSFKFEKLDNGNYKQIPQERKKVFPDNCVELIKIIINDYIKYPNYYHFFNIQNIYNFLFNEKMKDDKDNKEIDSEEVSNQISTVIFSINGGTRNMKGYFQQKMRDICKNANINIREYNLIYHGKIIDPDFNLEDIINEDDKKLKILRISLIEKNKMRKKIKSKDIICPRCGESIFMNIRDYKINLFDCINKHKINNLLLNEFEKTQNIDLSKIICNICKKAKDEMIYYDTFYRCLTCKINLCSSCKLNHISNHMIIIIIKKITFVLNIMKIINIIALNVN